MVGGVVDIVTKDYLFYDQKGYAIVFPLGRRSRVMILILIDLDSNFVGSIRH